MIKLIFLTVLNWSNPTLSHDSLRTETINGKLFIIHQVGDRETLYSLSRRYGTPIVSILEFNSKAGSGLEVGQLLKIPYAVKSKVQANESTIHKVAAKETLFSISKLYSVSVDDLKSWNNLQDNGLSLGQVLIVRRGTSQVVEPQVVKQTPGLHVVQPKETLFAISRKYGVSIQQLKEWNKLEGNELKVGSTLVVNGPATTPPTTNTVEVVKQAPEVNPETREPVKQETREPAKVDPKENTIRISENVRGSDEVKEGGLAELIEGTEGNRKYLGLHRSAKTGTILKIRNELNNREVFVRIVGPLPNTGINDNVVIKISKSAYDRLGAIDARFRVEVTYYK